MPTRVEDMQDILDVKGILLIDVRWMYLLAGILLALLLFFAGRSIYRKFISKSKGLASKTPSERAIYLLEQLISQKLIEKQQVRIFYFQLSDIFRSFIEEFWQKPAALATERELRTLLSELNLNAQQNEQADLVIRISELAKFAKYHPTKEEIFQSVKAVREFVTPLPTGGENAQA